jgi:glycosyltransferase involved in cell wall biosynthesis
MSDDPISVITLTRGRPEMLRRAVESVRSQDYPGLIEHLVVSDDDVDVPNTLAQFTSNSRRALRWHLEPRPESEHGHDSSDRRSVYPRLARLLNVGVQQATSPWLAFLDDDNAYEPDHLSSLMVCAHIEGCSAVHSARAMHWRDGAPYLEPFFPGAANADEGARIYALMCRRGVWISGTNILQDRVDADQSTFNNSTVISDGDPVFLVDQNLWLIERRLLVDCPINEDFSDADIAANTCPDDKMLEALVRNRVRIVSSRRPTVRYYLGGISNGDERTTSS